MRQRRKHQLYICCRGNRYHQQYWYKCCSPEAISISVSNTETANITPVLVRVYARREIVPIPRATKPQSSQKYHLYSIRHNIFNLSKFYTKPLSARPFVSGPKTGFMLLAAVMLLHEKCAGCGEAHQAAGCRWCCPMVPAVAWLCFMYLWACPPPLRSLLYFLAVPVAQSWPNAASAVGLLLLDDHLSLSTVVSVTFLYHFISYFSLIFEKAGKL